MRIDLYTNFPNKVQSIRLTSGFLESEYSIVSYYIIGKRVGEVGGIIWWIFGFLLIVDHLGWKTFCSSEYWHSYCHHHRGKGSTIPNTLNFILPFLSIFWTCFILLSTEVQIFVYYGTIWDCEGVVYSLLGWYPCTNGMRIIGWWCSKPCT